MKNWKDVDSLMKVLREAGITVRRVGETQEDLARRAFTLRCAMAQKTEKYFTPTDQLDEVSLVKALAFLASLGVDPLALLAYSKAIEALNESDGSKEDALGCNQAEQEANGLDLAELLFDKARIMIQQIL